LYNKNYKFLRAFLLTIEGLFMKRVVVTGLGCVSPIGNTVEENWTSLIHGKSGIDKITQITIPEGCVSIAGEVKNFKVEQFLSEKDARRSERFTHFAVAASKEALQNAGLTLDESNQFDVGVCIGVGIGGLNFYETQHKIFLEKGVKRVSPFLIPSFIPNIAAGYVAIETKAGGPNVCTATACASSAHAIADACMLIQSGQAKAMIAGGAEAAISPLAMTGFGQLRALCAEFQDEPWRASRPFDKARAGFVMGEGSGILILEELEFAKKRGARILCELGGFGLSGDAYHLTSPTPDGSGSARAMEKALQNSRLNKEDVDHINAHSTSTPVGDISEILSIKRVFKDHAPHLHITATKSMTGHLLGGAGGVEAVYSILALTRGIVPPTINLEDQDPQCDLNCTPLKAIERPMKAVLSNSFGFGGTNACLLFKQFDK
jgi:3-oxoacyl-[acyl-carrier-protein] synthase II